MAKTRNQKVEYIKTTVMSPAVEIQYCYLDKPDTQFSEKGQYKVTVLNPPQELIDKLMQVEADYRKETNKKPSKELKALGETEDGTPRITFKSNKPVPCFNAKVQPIPAKEVWSGSLVKLQISPGWCETGVYTGMVWYLTGVQLLKKGSGNFGTPKFAVEDTYLDDIVEAKEDAPFEVAEIDNEDVELDEEDLLV